jgi:hypothetical protein
MLSTMIYDPETSQYRVTVGLLAGLYPMIQIGLAEVPAAAMLRYPLNVPFRTMTDPGEGEDGNVHREAPGRP